jgi:hypothetical protein
MGSPFFCPLFNLFIVNGSVILSLYLEIITTVMNVFVT